MFRVFVLQLKKIYYFLPVCTFKLYFYPMFLQLYLVERNFLTFSGDPFKTTIFKCYMDTSFTFRLNIDRELAFRFPSVGTCDDGNESETDMISPRVYKHGYLSSL